MNSTIKEGFFSNFRSDLPASIVVFLVAVPLCLGIALASGAPLFSGIISGIVGGIVVSLISGSPLGVSGPAAGLAVIVLTAIQDLGSYEVFLLAVVLSGIIQIVLSFLKAGVIGYYFPSSVIKGMLSGIGIIIILKQIPHAVGYDSDPEGDWFFIQPDGHNTFSELAYMINNLSLSALIISVISLAILILWEQNFIRRIPIFKVVQGPLVVVVAGIGFKMIFDGIPGLSVRPDHLVTLPVASSFLDFFLLFTLPDFSAINRPEVHITAMTIAVVASLETLLSVEATDKLDPEKRITPTNKELKAQGVGNFISGLIGGLPVTQVIVRSSANVQSGAKSKASAFFHGFLLLICALSIPHVLNLIPLASLATILFVVGYKLAKPSLFKEMYRKGSSQWIPFVVTILGIVFTDLLRGIGLGMAVGIVQILWNNFKIPYHFDPESYEEGRPIRIRLAEEVSFLNKASILQTINQLPDNSHVIIDARETKSIHLDVVEILEDFSLNARTRGIEVEIEGGLKGSDHKPMEAFGDKVLDQADVSKWPGRS